MSDGRTGSPQPAVKAELPEDKEAKEARLKTLKTGLIHTIHSNPNNPKATALAKSILAREFNLVDRQIYLIFQTPNINIYTMEFLHRFLKEPESSDYFLVHPTVYGMVLKNITEHQSIEDPIEAKRIYKSYFKSLIESIRINPEDMQAGNQLYQLGFAPVQLGESMVWCGDITDSNSGKKVPFNRENDEHVFSLVPKICKNGSEGEGYFFENPSAVLAFKEGKELAETLVNRRLSESNSLTSTASVVDRTTAQRRYEEANQLRFTLQWKYDREIRFSANPVSPPTALTLFSPSSASSPSPSPSPPKSSPTQLEKDALADARKAAEAASKKAPPVTKWASADHKAHFLKKFMQEEADRATKKAKALATVAAVAADAAAGGAPVAADAVVTAKATISKKSIP